MTDWKGWCHVGNHGNNLFYFKRTKPRRKHRNAWQHESRFPYRFIAYLFLIILMPVGFVAGAVAGFDAAMIVIGLVFMCSVVAFRKHIQQNMPSASKVLQDISRRPVLYLRSFEQEALRFVDLPVDEKKQYSRILNYAEDVGLSGFEQNVYRLIEWIARTELEISLEGDVTFEKYFRAALMRHIGPLVALGNPEDELPVAGAYRDYQTDDGWKDIFFKRVSQCACIVMQLGSSNNLQFELTSIGSLGFCHRLFILTAPKNNPWENFDPLGADIPEGEPPTWKSFPPFWGENGYHLSTKTL